MSNLKKENGSSLIELLAVTLLISIVGLILVNILVTTTNNYKKQMKETANLNELSFITKQMTKDFRTSSMVKISANSVQFNDITYSYAEQKLTRKTIDYATDISVFCLADTKNIAVHTAGCAKVSIPTNFQDEGIYLYIENGKNQHIETTLYTRSDRD